MPGPGGPLLDLESGVSAVAHADSAENVRQTADQKRDSTDVGQHSSDSTEPSSPGESSSHLGAKTGNSEGHPVLDKLKKHIPPTVYNLSRRSYSYLKGPAPPKTWKIRPRLRRLQELPLRLIDRICWRQWQRILVLGIFYICWIATFAAVLHRSSVADDVNGYGQPLQLECGSAFWSQNNNCGINGTACMPFFDSSFAFRCPASCLSQQVLNVRAVGAQEVIYAPLVVGGPAPEEASGFSYRGDSFICSAAIHAGVISDRNGGCGVVALTGQQSDYPSVSRNGIESIGFDSYFPLSFTLQPTDASCRDSTWDTLAVSVVYTTILSLFTRSPSVFFYSTFIGCYLQAALATAKPSNSSVSALVETALGKLLPALFIMMVMYRIYIRRTLHDLTAQFEKTILWLGPCWVAVLADYTFELIPLSRLTAHDLGQEPGALASLIIIVLAIFFICIGQAWAFRLEGRLLRYLGLYACLGIILGLLAAIPQETLRIHHYILGLLFLPGTSMQTRPSLVYQGILVGLFINGVARWGFDSILQTAAALQGDALSGSLIPAITAVAPTVPNITFTWPGVPEGYSGTSILVNDVERYRDYNSSQDERSFTWQRLVDGAPEYFRFGFFSLSAAYGLGTGDYTEAGTWLTNGTWLQMGDGST